MLRRFIDDNDDDWDDWRDPIDDDSDDEDSDDETPTVPCPYCNRSIAEDVPRCPYCEQYVSDEDAPPAKKPWWIIAGVVACLYIIYRWTAG
jgi:hypothetical protein